MSTDMPLKKDAAKQQQYVRKKKLNNQTRFSCYKFRNTLNLRDDNVGNIIIIMNIFLFLMIPTERCLTLHLSW